MEIADIIWGNCTNSPRITLSGVRQIAKAISKRLKEKKQ